MSQAAGSLDRKYGVILVVDDHLGALRLAERALGRAGHRVDTASSVAEAFDAALPTHRFNSYSLEWRGASLEG